MDATAHRHRGAARSPWLRLYLWCEAAWRDFLYLVLPADCVVCGAEDESLCPECAAALRKQTAEPFRAEHSADALMSVSGHPLLPVIAAGEYRDALSQAILAFKNHGGTELGPQLSRCLARALDAMAAPPTSASVEFLPTISAWPSLSAGPGLSARPSLSVRPTLSPPRVLFVVPIPSTGNGWRRRGYDPVALLLRTLVREGRLPSGMEIVPVLRIKTRLPWHRRHQKGLGRAARRRNIRNTMKIKQKFLHQFRLKAKPSGQNIIDVVLVDDVLTTGSTLREAAKTLESSGFRVRGAVVLAAARAPSGTSDDDREEGRAENNL